MSKQQRDRSSRRKAQLSDTFLVVTEGRVPTGLALDGPVLIGPFSGDRQAREYAKVFPDRFQTYAVESMVAEAVLPDSWFEEALPDSVSFGGRRQFKVEVSNEIGAIRALGVGCVVRVNGDRYLGPSGQWGPIEEAVVFESEGEAYAEALTQRINEIATFTVEEAFPT